MTQKPRDGEATEFRVEAPEAEQVCLVLESDGGATTWLPMNADGTGGWRLTHRIPLGDFRLRYFKQENRVWFNCGESGLEARRLATVA